MLAGLEHERRIVWLEDVTLLPYVRQSQFVIRFPVRRPAWHNRGRLVGYAELGPTSKADMFGQHPRRLFWMAENDPYPPDDPVWYPAEAVLVDSVKPGVWGVMDSAVFEARYRQPFLTRQAAEAECLGTAAAHA